MANRQWIAALNLGECKNKSDGKEDRAFFDVLKFRNRPLRSCGITKKEVGF
jgi:hypothetical protein